MAERRIVRHPLDVSDREPRLGNAGRSRDPTGLVQREVRRDHTRQIGGGGSLDRRPVVVDPIDEERGKVDGPRQRALVVAWDRLGSRAVG